MNSNADSRNGQSHSRGASSNGFVAASHQKPQTAFNGQYGGGASRTDIGRVTSQTRLNYTPLAQLPRSRECENMSPLPQPARQSEMINGLRSQLLNIRSEVSKLLVDKPSKNQTEDKAPLGKRLNTFQDQINAIQTVEGRASEAGRPKGQTSLRCLQVENQSLKLELNGLKKRYAEKKHAHEQQVSVLNKKVKALELTLKTNEENVLAYKAEIEKEMMSIKDQLTDSKIEVKKAEMQRQIGKYHQQLKLYEENVKKLEKELLDTRKVYTDRLNECEAQVSIVQQQMLEKSEITGRLREELLASKIVVAKENYDITVQTDDQIDEEKQSQKKYISILREECRSLTTMFDELATHLRELQNKPVVETETQTDMIKVKEVQKQTIVVEVPSTNNEQYQDLKKQYHAKVEELRQQEILESQRFSQLQSQTDSLRVQIIELDKALNLATKEVSSFKKQLVDQQVKHEQQLANLIPKEPLKAFQSPPKDVKGECDLKQYAEELQVHNQRLFNELHFRDRELEEARHEIKQLADLYCQVTEEIGQKDRQLNDLHNELTDKLNIECSRNDSLQNRVQAAELDYRTVLEDLKTEIRQLIFSRPTMEGKSFDEALKVQIEEINELKSMINRKSEQIYQLKDHITCNRSQVESIKAELEIEKLKAIAERKNMQVGFQVELQKLKNDAEAEKKTAESVSSKLRAAVEETRSKDEFIQKYIMGKRVSAEEKFQVEEFFKQYRLDFPTSKLKDKLYAQAKQIRRLEHINERLAIEISSVRLRSHDKLVTVSEAPTQVSSDQCLSEPDCF